MALSHFVKRDLSRFAWAVARCDKQAMIGAPQFTSGTDFVARLADVDFWAPYVAEVLSRHGLADARQAPVAGFNGTYPTFVVGDQVVKLFGWASAWRESHRAERAAYGLLASDPGIAAPRLLAEGRLYAEPQAPWPYLVTSRMPGIAAWRADLTGTQELGLAKALGRQIARVHALPTVGLATDEDWRALDVTAGARQSSLPGHLIAQIEAFLSRLEPFDRVVVNGDVVANHVYVENGRFTGIIDWGDTMVTDRHYELIQIHRDMFGCDKALLGKFLEASEWPVAKGFARQAMGLALTRQAVGAAQHHTMDVFEPVAERFPLTDIATLDELAEVLFGL